MYIGDIESDSPSGSRPSSMHSEFLNKPGLAHSFTERQANQFVKINRASSQMDHLTFKATLLTDPSKCVMVEISRDSAILNLQRRIAEEMTNHFDLFKSLDGVRVFNITKVQNKKAVLALEEGVSSLLEDGEEILFELTSLNFWLRVNFRLLV